MEPSDVIALCALAVAIAAIVLSVYEGYQARKHNQLSVQPLLLSTFHGSAPEGRFSLGVENVGLGPAFIDNIIVIHDRQTFDLSQERPFSRLAQALGIYRPECLYATFSPGDPLATGEHLQLIECAQAEVSVPEMKRITDILRGLDVIVKYRTLYGHTHTYYSSVPRAPALNAPGRRYR